MAQELTKSGMETVKDLIYGKKGEFAKALQKGVDVDVFLRASMTMVQQTPKLIECTSASLYLALLRSAQLSLSPDGTLGQAYLVPYAKQCVLIIGYKGLRELALRTDKYADVVARVVFSKDKFSLKFGSEEYLHHEPHEGDRGEMRGVYAIATTMGGQKIVDFMWGAEVIKIRNKYSQAYKTAEKGYKGKPPAKDSMWHTDPERAWEKTILRQLCGNRLQLSVKAQGVMVKEDRMNAGLEIPEDEMEGIIDIDPNGKEEKPEVADDKKGVEGLQNTVEAKTGEFQVTGDPPTAATPGTGGAGKQKNDANKKADLRIAIVEKIKATFPKLPWQKKLDEIASQTFGQKLQDFNVENEGVKSLETLWKAVDAL